MSKWKKLPTLNTSGYQGCLNCPSKPSRAHMRTKIAVGFGDAYISRDKAIVWRENMKTDWASVPRLSRFERMAKADPHHDWRLVLNAPLSFVEYQRQGPGLWVLVKTGQGFA